MSRKINLTTRELWAELFKAPTVEDYFESSRHSRSLPVFSEYITLLCNEKGEKPEHILKKSCIESSFGHKLFSGTRNPSRDTVLQLAFGFELDNDETQQLLKIARMSALHPRVKRDAVIAFCLHRHISLIETQQLLYENKLPVLGEKRNEKR